VLGISVETAKNVGIGAIAVLLTLMLVFGWIVKKVVGKLVVILVLGGLALGVWTQRNDLEHCADQVKISGSTASCHLFGRDFKLTPPA
jgi:hypothetical protein